MITIAFFNCRGGAGTTTLVYHLAWMFRELGLNVVAADYDPQASLTRMFLEDDQLEALSPDPHIVAVSDKIGLIVGNIELAGFEDKLSEAWLQCRVGDQDAFQKVTANCRATKAAADSVEADVVLMDMGPNLGAINRSALLAADFVIIPVASDVFMLRGLRLLGTKLKEWRDAWDEMPSINPSFSLTAGAMVPAGYLFPQYYPMRSGRSFDREILRRIANISSQYQASVLNTEIPRSFLPQNDEDCLATLWRYPSLIPLALESRKPMFRLKPADGAIGSEIEAVKACHSDFKKLAIRIAERTGLKLP